MLNGHDNLTIKNCTFINYARPIQLKNTDRTTIRNITLLNTTELNFYLECSGLACYNNTLTDIIIDSAGSDTLIQADGYINTLVNNITFIVNQFSTTTQYLFKSYSDGIDNVTLSNSNIGSLGAYLTLSSKTGNVTINNIISTRNSTYFVYMQNYVSAFLNISNSYCNGTHCGVYAGHITRITIQNTTLEATNLEPIRLDSGCTYALIDNNIIINSNWNSIDADGNYTIISNNYCSNADHNCIDRWSTDWHLFNSSVRSLLCFDIMDDETLHNEHLEIQTLLKQIDTSNYIDWNSWWITKLHRDYPVGPTGHLLENGHTAVANKILEHDSN
jgi:hypothetical protein